MQVQLLVERQGQNEYIAKLGGSSYRFKRNDHGDMVAEISDSDVITKISDPRNGSFKPYVIPEVKDTRVFDETVDENVTTSPDSTEESFACPVCGKSFDTSGKMNSHMGGAHRKG